ncbi:MAG: TadE family type IV pilus minor pilin [Gordonia sp. (in: high G+C Gram-positive bacteria)]|uniref:TadE family type IV pilus minor pilin n=1 Tax=Gordonia sp. (in: high G+C Gram-positive bacteria) TaxID=84139 RepID=UPI003BB5D98F
MSQPWWRRLAADETGMVTVEAAYALAALAAFVVLGVGAIGGVVAQLRCADAAREVARLAAVGDTQAAAVGARVAPSGARIEVRTQGDQVVATVVAKIPLLPLLDISARSVAAVEPNAAAASTVD